MSIEHERFLTGSRQYWVGREYSTEVEKMKWIDVPTHIGKFLDNTTYYFNAERLSSRMVEHNMSVSDMDTCLKWFVDHSGHCFTYYHDSQNGYSTRWRMSKKPFTHKSYNYYAKGLASTIQENQFYVNESVFSGGAINMDNATLTDWYNHVLTALPKAKMDYIAKQDNRKVIDAQHLQDKLGDYNSRLLSRLGELDIHEFLTNAIENKFEEMLYHQWNTHPLAEADDFVATLTDEFMTDTTGMVLDEEIHKVTVANTQVKQIGASVFANILAIESAKEQALASIASLATTTQESEEE